MTAQSHETGAALVILHELLDLTAEDEYHRWYEEEHIPERLVLPGVTDVARYQNTLDASRYLIYYKLDSLAALTDDTYQFHLHHDGTAWTKRMRTLFHMPYRNVYVGNAWSNVDMPQNMLAIFGDNGATHDGRRLTSVQHEPKNLLLHALDAPILQSQMKLGIDVARSPTERTTHSYQLVGAYGEDQNGGT